MIKQKINKSDNKNDPIASLDFKNSKAEKNTKHVNKSGIICNNNQGNGVKQ